jgi:hypothetical protein
MADAIERLYRLSVDGTPAVRELEKIARSTDSVDKRMASLAQGIRNAGAALGVSFAAGVIVDRFMAVVASMDEVVKAAQRIGVATDKLQALRYAATASGSSAEALDRGLQHLSQNLQDVSQGTSDAAQALRAFGVTSGDTTASALAKIADAFAKLPDGAQKSALAVAIFGRNGNELIPTLNAGTKGLAAMSDEAKKLGLVLSDDALKAAEDFNNQLDLLGNTAAGAARSFVSGLLPALQSVAKELVRVSGGTGGLHEWGAAIGEDVVRIAMGVSLLAGGLRDVMAVQEGIRKFATSPAWEWGDIYKETTDKIGKANAETITSLENLVREWKKTKQEIETPWHIPLALPPETDVEKRLRAEKEAAEKAAKAKKDAAEADRIAARAADDLYAASAPMRKLWEDLRTETIETAGAQRLLNDAMGVYVDTTGKITDANIDQANANRRVEDSINAQIKAQKDADLEMQGMIALTVTGTDEQKKLAGAWLEHELALKHIAPVYDEITEAQEIVSAGFDRFVESLSSGSVTAAEAFRGMVQSILADLLKLLAKQAILKMFTGGAGAAVAPPPSTGIQAALGAVFAAGRVLPFARGGVISQGLTLPMALMGEAGPEAVLPLRRGANGNLGVESAGTVPLNIAIHNHADARVSAQRDGAGDLQIIIEATKRSMAVDIRRGGNEISRAHEAAFRLSRGASAPF